MLHRMNFKNVYILLFLALIYNTNQAQSDFNQLETDLAFHCDVMTNAAEGRHRMIAQNHFSKGFVKALKEKNAYSYPFDSLKWISKKYADDNSFRILTWEAKESDVLYHYFGYLQMSDGALIPLKDQFKNIENLNSALTADEWVGSVYYHIMAVDGPDKEKYYLLFGLNRWDKNENRKVVDVLWFDKNKNPVFGKPVFNKSEDSKNNLKLNRLLFTYSSDAQMTVNYNPGMKMILFDHLIPRMSRTDKSKQTYVPDGSYSGYTEDKGIWKRVEKLANQVMETAPRPTPVLDGRKGKKIFGN